MIFLAAEELIVLNRRMVSLYGGLYTAGDNLANRDSLEYLVEAVPSVVFGQERYASVYEKAAAYAFFIIKDHVFHDGNKRTGMQAAIVFLEANGHPILTATDDELVAAAVAVACGETSLGDLAQFFERVCTEF